MVYLVIILLIHYNCHVKMQLNDIIKYQLVSGICSLSYHYEPIMPKMGSILILVSVHHYFIVTIICMDVFAIT